ncbi:MAG: hypothetical protein HQ596_07180 [Candidatus Saganbacteria bacterium]|nr:hypothetical protein [Candidatus Saganbacteria bacterium]
MQKVIAILLIGTLLFSCAYATNTGILITAETYSKELILEGDANNPIIISPPPRIILSDKTQKIVVIPEEIELKEELQEFKVFRNRYVIFGIYLFSALYYNWLTRHR